MKLKLLDINEVTLETKDKLCKENISLVVDNTNITPENIKSGVSILGVNGTLQSGGADEEDLKASYEQGYEAGSADALKDVTTLKGYLDITKSTANSFKNYTGTSVEGLIKYDDTSKVTNMRSMFFGCTSLRIIPALDTSNVTDMNRMFFGCTSLRTIPALDTSKVTDMQYMFYDCRNLTTIPALDMSKVTSMTYMFVNCGNLTTILMYGMKVSFDISYSNGFEASDLVTILNNLATVTSTRTLTMGATNLAKLTDEQKAIATNKGWTLA